MRAAEERKLNESSTALNKFSFPWIKGLVRCFGLGIFLLSLNGETASCCPSLFPSISQQHLSGKIETLCLFPSFTHLSIEVAGAIFKVCNENINHYTPFNSWN